MAKPKKDDKPNDKDFGSGGLEDLVSGKKVGDNTYFDHKKFTDDTNKEFTQEKRMIGLVALYTQSYNNGEKILISNYVGHALQGVEMERVGKDEEVDVSSFLKDYVKNKLLDDVLNEKVGRDMLRAFGEVEFYGTKLGTGINLHNPGKKEAKQLLARMSVLARAYSEVNGNPLNLDPYFKKIEKKPEKTEKK